MIYTASNFHPKSDTVPAHVGLIPDGIRRWSKTNGTSLLEGYSIAMNNLGKIVDFLFSRNTRMVSVYLSSEQNMSRSPEELNAFCTAESRFCLDTARELSQKHGTKVVGVGNREAVPEYFAEAVATIENFTVSYSKTELYLCVAYNPITEIEEAVLESCGTGACFINNLKVKEPIDLIIRSSGANLMSNFLPLQSSFARLYFLEKQFNDVQLTDIEQLLAEFSQLNRLYGT